MKNFLLVASFLPAIQQRKVEFLTLKHWMQSMLKFKEVDLYMSKEKTITISSATLFFNQELCCGFI
jgi:hypothetical protein